MKFNLLALGLVIAGAAHSSGAERKSLPGHVPAVVTRLQPVDHLPASMNLRLALGLPLQHRQDLAAFLEQLYDPASTNFHQYLTPAQFTARFGPTAQEYQGVLEFARTNGFSVTATHPNRVLLDVRAPIAAIEKTFQIKLRVYHHPTEPRDFYAPDLEPSVPASVPMLDISGLDNYILPRPLDLKKVAHNGNRFVSYATGSGPGGDFIGNDFRAAYAPGVTNDGAGQFIGLFEFGPYFTNDIYMYQTNAGLPTSIVISNILLDGVSGIPAPGTDDGEEALDIDMAMCMAPGATLLVYEGNNGNDIFNRMATDNLAKQMSCSFGYSPMPASTEQIFMEYAAQGQSMFVASGDGGAYAFSPGAMFPQAEDPYLTIVGGTSLTTSSPGGPWQSETTWRGSGGGTSTHWGIPSWQQGINMQNNLGSTTLRNIPDVAMLADTVLFWVYKNGITGTVGGTSAAAPLWAGFTALMNQEAAKRGVAPVGFVNPAIYALGKRGGAAYTQAFHDITTGNNFSPNNATKYAAFPGYDLCTGWGTPSGSNTINVLVGTGTNDFALYATAVGPNIIRGAVVTTTLSILPLSGFSGSVTFSISGLPSGMSASFNPTITTGSSLLTITTGANMPATNVTLTVTGRSGSLTHTLTLSLTISAPLPGATIANLSSAFNRAGIYTDGASFSSGGFDGDGFAYSANLLGTAPSANGILFNLGPANTLDVIKGTGQTISLPVGHFTTLQMLASGVNGDQLNQTFTITYTDNSTTSVSQSLSDWAGSPKYAGESFVSAMAYRNASGGTRDTGTAVNVFAYNFTLDQTKTVRSITLPNNANVVLLAITLVNAPAVAPLASAYNLIGMYTDGTTFTNNGGIDGGGSAYSATRLGLSQTWNGVAFSLGPPNVSNVIAGTGQFIPLPVGNYSALRMLATGIQGNQALQLFAVTYTDGTTNFFTQSLSDWFTPQNYAGESKAITLGYRNTSGGTKDNRTFYVYGYSFALNSAKVVQSIRLPGNAHVVLLAISLIPNWPPAFLNNPFTMPAITAGQNYSGTLAGTATDLNDDTLTFARVSGPAWLNVATSGNLSGMPLSGDVGANSFVVSATDPGGLSAQATMNIAVNPALPIIANAALQGTSLQLSWTGGISPYQVQMSTDLSSPDWQSVATLSATNLVLSMTNAAAYYRVVGQ